MKNESLKCGVFHVIFFFDGFPSPNFKNGKLRLGKETQGKANKWEEIQFEFRLSDAQKGSFLGETENSR